MTQQIKDQIASLSSGAWLDTAKNRCNIHFGGLKIEQIIPSDESRLPSWSVMHKVLSTGLSNLQGRLVTTIMCEADKMTVESKDSFYLLLFQSVFGCMAA